MGIVQSGFGNIAEFAITILALQANLPEVVKIAIVGSLLGNAVLLGGVAGLLPIIRGGWRATLCFDRRLFSGIATLSIIAFAPMAILTVPSDLLTGNRQGVSLVAGIALTVVGVFFILMELRAPHMPGEKLDAPESKLSFREGIVYLAVGGVMAALTAEWFVAGFEPATEAIGIPTAFAALVIIPLLGNVAENYVALRYAWAGDGDAAMSVIMHSVVQIALLMTGLLVIVSQFIGQHAAEPPARPGAGGRAGPGTDRALDDPVRRRDAAGRGARPRGRLRDPRRHDLGRGRARHLGAQSPATGVTGAPGSGSFSPTTTPSSSQTPMRRNFARRSARRCSIGSASIESSAWAIASPSRRAARS